MTDRPTVLVLESHGKAGLPIIESCARHGLRVIAASSHRVNLGFSSRAVRERVIYPPVVEEPAACIEFLVRYLRRRRVTVLFPIGDVMTDLIARHQDRVRPWTRLVLPPYATFVRGRSKIATLQAAEAAGVPVPRTWYLDRLTVEEIARQASYPVLVKPDLSAGARGIIEVRGPAELPAAVARVREKFDPCFVQEFVPQHGMQFKVDAIVHPDGRMLAGVAYAKLRYYPPTGGSSVLNETVDRPDIVANAMKVLGQLGWHGFCDFDFIEDPRDGVVKLMEINPRYPESFRATEAAGLDMAYMMYRLAMGEDCPADRTLKVGRYVRFLAGDIMWFLTSPDRWRARPSFFDFFNPRTVDQILSARDLGPTVGYLVENLLILMDRKARAERFRLGRARREALAMGAQEHKSARVRPCERRQDQVCHAERSEESRP